MTWRCWRYGGRSGNGWPSPSRGACHRVSSSVIALLRTVVRGCPISRCVTSGHPPRTIDDASSMMARIPARRICDPFAAHSRSIFVRTRPICTLNGPLSPLRSRSRFVRTLGNALRSPLLSDNAARSSQPSQETAPCADAESRTRDSDRALRHCSTTATSQHRKPVQPHQGNRGITGLGWFGRLLAEAVRGRPSCSEPSPPAPERSGEPPSPPR